MKAFIFVLDLDVYHSSLTIFPRLYSVWSSAFRGSSVDQKYRMIKNITRPSRNKGNETEWEVGASLLNSVFDIGIQITHRTCGLKLEGLWYKLTLQKGYIYHSAIHFFVFLWFCIFFGMQEIIPTWFSFYHFFVSFRCLFNRHVILSRANLHSL